MHISVKSRIFYAVVPDLQKRAYRPGTWTANDFESPTIYCIGLFYCYLKWGRENITHLCFHVRVSSVADSTAVWGACGS